MKKITLILSCVLTLSFVSCSSNDATNTALRGVVSGIELRRVFEDVLADWITQPLGTEFDFTTSCDTGSIAVVATITPETPTSGTVVSTFTMDSCAYTFTGELLCGRENPTITFKSGELDITGEFSGGGITSAATFIINGTLVVAYYAEDFTCEIVDLTAVGEAGTFAFTTGTVCGIEWATIKTYTDQEPEDQTFCTAE